MNLKEQIGKVFMVGLPSSELDDPSKRVLEIIRPGSVILFSRNIVDRQQVSELISRIENFLGYKPLIAIDQEGGIVTRLTKGFSISPGAMALASTKCSENAEITGRILGAEMKESGIDWDLAPVVDINNNIQNPAIGIRSFSDDRDTVIEYASKFILGLEEGGVLTCLKHFPGNGRVVTDPHLDMPILDISREEIFKTELTPFLTLDAPSWMPTHMYVPALQTSKEPVTISKDVLTTMIRKELKYDGVLLADDFNMGGASKSHLPEELAYQSLMAGMDMISFCDDSAKQIRVSTYLHKEFEQNEKLAEKITIAADRIDTLFEKRKVLDQTVRAKEDYQRNKIILDNISFQSVHVVKNRNNVLPLSEAGNIFAVKAARHVLVEDSSMGIPEVVHKASELFKCEVTLYDERILEEKSSAMIKNAAGKVNIIFTENAHLVDSYRLFIEKLTRVSQTLVLVALRNPYDADINGIENAICSYGYNRSQQEEIVRKLFKN